MRRRTPPPLHVWIRFYLGSLLGIGGLGVLGENVVPLHAISAGVSLLAVAIGAVLAISGMVRTRS
jgi:hypothetical protein